MSRISKLSEDQVKEGLKFQSDSVTGRVLIALTRVILTERWKQNMS